MKYVNHTILVGILDIFQFLQNDCNELVFVASN